MQHRVLTFAFAALLAAPVFAQKTTTTAAPGTAADRRENQQDRIANGVQSGELTAGETKKLETREANVNSEIKNDRSANGGKLTPQERKQINRQQKNVSESIYTDKHNTNAANFGNNEVGQRRENQQDRIANGIKNGSMTANEAARAENHEQGINKQIASDRAANGGKLTPQERKQINRQQNGASRQVFREKHNGARQPK
jgi:FlaG/FlaF family flagellin (archaellin)